MTEQCLSCAVGDCTVELLIPNPTTNVTFSPDNLHAQRLSRETVLRVIVGIKLEFFLL